METKPACCCCGLAFIVALIVTGVGFYLFTPSSTVVTGDHDFMDEHKSFIERLSLLSLSNADSGTSWSTWGVAALLTVAAISSCYWFYRKVHLPRHRRSRNDREQQQRQQEFIMDLMNRPVPS